jgi:uncharacterized protein YxjI
MKLFIKQKVFSWGEKFSVFDETGCERYSVRGEMLTLGRKLHVYDDSDRERAFIRQKLLTFMPRFTVSVEGRETAEIRQKFTLAKPSYLVSGQEWLVTGDFLAHEYTITAQDGREVAAVTKRWFTWGDTYEVDACRSEDMLLVLCVTIAIDASLMQYAA